MYDGVSFLLHKCEDVSYRFILFTRAVIPFMGAIVKWARVTLKDVSLK